MIECQFCYCKGKKEDMMGWDESPICPICVKESKRTEPLVCRECGFSGMIFSSKSTAYTIRYTCPNCSSHNVRDPDCDEPEDIEIEI